MKRLAVAAALVIAPLAGAHASSFLDDPAFQARYAECSHVTVDPGAVQPRTPFPDETPEQAKVYDRMVADALVADRCRLSNMVWAKVDPDNRFQHCQDMMGYIAAGFTHIEGWSRAPFRTAKGLYEVCTDKDRWLISKWTFHCVQPSIIGPHRDVVHLAVRYDQDQHDEGYEGFVPRIAIRDLAYVADGKGGQSMAILDHGAFDVRAEAIGAEAIKSECKPAPAQVYSLFQYDH